MSEVENFDVYDLSDAVAGDALVELSPLQFDTGEYTSLDQFVFNLALLPDKPKRVHNYQLSLNGRVAQDKMSNYLSHEGESSSALKEILKTPRHYLIHKNEELPKRSADHFELGTFVHSAFLEPAKFDKVIVEPKANKATIEGCKELVIFYWRTLNMYGEDLSQLNHGALKYLVVELRSKAEELGCTFVKEDDAQIINCIRATYKMYGGGILPKIFKAIKSEVSMYGKDPSTGLKVKIRPDALMLEENFGVNGIISLKTTSATTEDAFVRDAAKYKYELSEGMYLDVASSVTGRRFSATLMVVLQTVVPYGIMVFYWDAEDLYVGKYKYHQALDILKQCKDTNQWLGFDCKAEAGNYGILEMKLPAYTKLELPSQGINTD